MKNTVKKQKKLFDDGWYTGMADRYAVHTVSGGDPMRFLRMCSVFFLFFLLILPVSAGSGTVAVPILMYHHFTMDQKNENGNCISVDAFAAQLAALSQAGYHSVTAADCIAFVESGKPLPDNPILLTADDGYRSVLEMALPIADRFGFSLSVAVIGSHITGAAVDGIPHFTISEALHHPLSDRLELTSHTYTMHDADGQGVTMDPDAFALDIALMRGIGGAEQTEIGRVFVYPFGKYTPQSEMILQNAGYHASLAICSGVYRVAVLTEGKKESLFAMPRIAMDGTIDGPALISILHREKSKIPTEST